MLAQGSFAFLDAPKDPQVVACDNLPSLPFPLFRIVNARNDEGLARVRRTLRERRHRAPAVLRERGFYDFIIVRGRATPRVSR